MVRFLHLSTGGTIITKDNFEEADLTEDNWNRHDFHPGGKCLYLSAVDETGESAWLKHAKSKYAEDPEINGEYQQWILSTRNYFEIDLSRSKILVIDILRRFLDPF